MAINQRALASAIVAALAFATMSGFSWDEKTVDGIDECNVIYTDPNDPSQQGPDWVDWVPDVGHPVFWGYQDVGTAEGAPGDTRVYYPSLAGSPQNAEIAKQCKADYPVVLFLHGQPPKGESTPAYNREFEHIGMDLARSGYIVVAPSYRATLPEGDNGTAMVAEVMADLDWVRQSWDKAQWVDSKSARTAVAGHSFGALLATRVAADHPEFGAFVGLSGGYTHLDDPLGSLEAIKMPTFFSWAEGNGSTLGYENMDGNPKLFDPLSGVKYALPFKGEHFDYLRDPGGGELTGPCHPRIGGALADLATLFVAKFLPVEGSEPVHFALLKPEVSLTPEQEFYAGSHLNSVEIVDSQPGCRINMRFDLLLLSGTRVIGP